MSGPLPSGRLQGSVPATLGLIPLNASSVQWVTLPTQDCLRSRGRLWERSLSPQMAAHGHRRRPSPAAPSCCSPGLSTVHYGCIMDTVPMPPCHDPLSAHNVRDPAQPPVPGCRHGWLPCLGRGFQTFMETPPTPRHPRGHTWALAGERAAGNRPWELGAEAPASAPGQADSLVAVHRARHPVSGFHHILSSADAHFHRQ